MGGVLKKKKKEELDGSGNKRISHFAKDSRTSWGKDDNSVCVCVYEWLSVCEGEREEWTSVCPFSGCWFIDNGRDESGGGQEVILLMINVSVVLA